jgi:hypothetical protein
MSVGNVRECSTRGLLIILADRLLSSLQLHALKPRSRSSRASEKGSANRSQLKGKKETTGPNTITPLAVLLHDFVESGCMAVCEACLCFGLFCWHIILDSLGLHFDPSMLCVERIQISVCSADTSLKTALVRLLIPKCATGLHRARLPSQSIANPDQTGAYHT